MICERRELSATLNLKRRRRRCWKGAEVVGGWPTGSCNRGADANRTWGIGFVGTISTSVRIIMAYTDGHNVEHLRWIKPLQCGRILRVLLFLTGRVNNC